MFGTFRMAFGFFLFGLAIGLLTAPRSGRATRRMIVREVSTLLNVSPQDIYPHGEEYAERIGGTSLEMQRPAQAPPEQYPGS